MKTDESITAYLRVKLFVVPVITDKLVSTFWQCSGVGCLMHFQLVSTEYDIVIDLHIACMLII